MKILLISVNASTFVLKDYNILNSNYATTLCLYGECSAKEIFNLIKDHDLVIFWFASIRFLLPVFFARLINKKVITIAGGYDVSKVENGSMQSSWKALIIKSILKLSTNIVAISKSSFNEITANCNIRSDAIELIYHGFQRIDNIVVKKKRDIVLTIGYIDDLSFIRKGIDRFFELAMKMGNVEFHFIGTFDVKKLNIEVPKNLILHGHLKINDEDFIDILEQSKVYFQLSRHESFGCSVAEAMQYACIPVVTNLYSLPEVVGDCGVIIDDADDIENVKIQIENVFKNYNETWARKCVERINNKFSIDERSSKLLSFIKEFASS